MDKDFRYHNVSYGGIHQLLTVEYWESRPRYDIRKCPGEALPDFNHHYNEPVIKVEGMEDPRRIRIIFEDPSDVPWTIEVRATGRSYISLGDLWNEIFNSLQKPVERSEWALTMLSLPSTLRGHKKRSLNSLMKNRCQALQAGRLLRVDWLHSSFGTYFVGLKKADNTADSMLLPGEQKCEYTFVAKFSSKSQTLKQ